MLFCRGPGDTNWPCMLSVPPCCTVVPGAIWTELRFSSPAAPFYKNLESTIAEPESLVIFNRKLSSVSKNNKKINSIVALLGVTVYLQCYATHSRPAALQSYLQTLALHSLKFLLDLPQLILLPLNIGLNHPRPLLQLFFYVLHGFQLVAELHYWLSKTSERGKGRKVSSKLLLQTFS